MNTLNTWKKLCDMTGPYETDSAAFAVSYRTNVEKENDMKKESSVSESVYKSTVDAIQNEAWDKKNAIDAEAKEKLARAAREREMAEMKERVDMWAEEIYARYEALHERGFSEDLAIEFLKIYISKN